jgi:hypothetical protein
MNNPAIPEPKPTLSEALAIIINGLCAAMQRESENDRYIIPMCIRLWTRLLHLTKRYNRLVTLWREGRLTPYRPRPYRQRTKWPEPPKKPGEEPKPKHTLPSAFGWIVKYVPGAALYRDQLRELLADPEMIAFLTAAPQAGRLLRPLCRTLGVALTAELLPRKKPEPATTPPATTPPATTTPGEPTQGEPTQADPQPARAKKPDPCASDTHAGDPLWARPVSLWTNPPRRRS